MGPGAHEHLRRSVAETQDLIDVIRMVRTACSIDNPGCAPETLSGMEIVFPRYALRTLYHARSMIDKLLAISGGTRYLAAAGIYALDNHVERMKEDHLRAKTMEKELQASSFVEDVANYLWNVK